MDQKKIETEKKDMKIGGLIGNEKGFNWWEGDKRVMGHEKDQLSNNLKNTYIVMHNSTIYFERVINLAYN